MPNERTVKAAIDYYLQGLRASGAPVWFVKIAGGTFQRLGIPDYIGCVKGRFVAVELKHPEDLSADLTPMQRVIKGYIEGAGGIYFVCRAKSFFRMRIDEISAM